MDWMMGHFQVLFSGQVVEGANEATVRQNLARRLGLDERKVAQLFSGRTVVIRSELSRNEADDLQRELSALGALARIKDVSPDDRAKFKIDKKTRDQTLNDITAAHVECARCGHLQLESEFCARCGVDMATAEKLKRKEDLLIEKKIRGLKVQKTVAAPAAVDQPGDALEPIQPIKRRSAGHRHVGARSRAVAPDSRPQKPEGNDSGTSPQNPSGGFWRNLFNPSRKDERSH
jgi:ribosomal protein L37E